MGIPEKLLQLKAANRFTQEYIGQQIGVHYTSYARWERGENLPSLEHLIKLAELYNVDLDFFTDRESGEGSLQKFPSIAEDRKKEYRPKQGAGNPTSITITLDGSESSLQSAISKITKLSRLISDGYL